MDGRAAAHPAQGPCDSCLLKRGNLCPPAGVFPDGDIIQEVALDESEMIRRARAGDRQAVEELMGLHQEAAFRLAYLMLGDADEAKDVVQESLLRALRSLHRFDPARPWRPWLLRITANQARNRRRTLARYWAALQRALRAEAQYPTPHAGRTAGDPADGRLASQRLWQAIRQLSRPDQEALYLRYFLDLSEAEMAEQMRMAPGTVKSRLHRATGRLRTLVRRDFPDLAPGGDE